MTELFDVTGLIEKYRKLEQENKELKEIINKSARSFCNDYLKTFEENKFLNNQIMEVKFNAQQEIEFLTEENNNYRSALEEIREKAQHCITQDVCALCDYSKECAVPDADGLVYDNNRLLIKLINEVLND